MTHLPTEDETPVPGELLLYTSPDGNIRLDLRIHDETLWMTQQMMAELFQTSKQNIGQHIANILQEGELQEDGTVKKFFTVRLEGERQVKRSVIFYNLDMIISVGYRVNSIRGTQFRIWATQRLKEYMIKGFAIDDERLKNPPIPGTTPLPDYFDELLERIRDIRASERRMYLRIKDVFAMAADYVPSGKETTEFFSSIQNKLHYAITGHSAAELMMMRADASAPNMGLTSWAGDRIHVSDVTVAKEEEISDFNRLTSLCLDFVEDQAKKRREIFLHEWEDELNELLRLMGRHVLKGKGQRSKKQAQAHVRGQYRLYEERRRLDEHQLGNPGR
ncbi:MAG: virulence RhuM family protein [Akkermansia sp.]